MKKFSGKTLEENKEEEGSEPPKVESQEVRVKARGCPVHGRLVRFFFGLTEMCQYRYKSERVTNVLLALGEGSIE